MGVASVEKYEELCSSLQKYIADLTENCNDMRQSSKDCVDNCDDDTNAKKAQGKVEKCVSDIESNFESINAVIQYLQETIEELRESESVIGDD